ncbi:MAG: hypothetical protein H0T62_11720 [Parachlamydiaceae bacterium]|nr:hypothetical protein [Parachlamydiaceae bacterium]
MYSFDPSLKSETGYKFRNPLYAGADAEIKGFNAEFSESEEELIEKLKASDSQIVFFRKFSAHPHQKVLDILMAAIFNGNIDLYDIAFRCYRETKVEGTILHPILDDIVLNSNCDDNTLMKHFESKAKIVHQFVENLELGLADELGHDALIDIQKALKK